ncbi:uncharacterized protein PV09_04478 [Verruconis gallopava]|uniref:Calmodulin n=1 Tax=Verruconis gallopava TaxID=253628 RepID=A0A0D1YVM1_9PEZI|nr:uncharacterized protein PV09_04478 [Verruconis gallopava]KIW04752.1 hypothetical protein PV09_04478 [Verruconis gallopava]
MSASLTPEQLAEYREAFKIFDKNGDGQITAEELGEIMRSLGQNPTATELQDIIAELDIDNSGAVDFDEFIRMMGQKLTSGGAEDDELLQAFKVFDKDGSGTISAQELKELMISIGESLSKDEIDEMIREADKDGDGVIDYKEFVQLMKEK